VLLALDTSTASITVCVYDEDDDVVLASRDGLGPMKHGELLAPAIADSLAEAGVARQDLTAIVVGVGPGPYTGLRVGVVTARTLGYALEIPVYGVCSLDALARAAIADGPAGGLAEPFVVTTDARRKELFWASYDESGARLDGPFVDRPVDLPADLLADPLVGSLSDPLVDREGDGNIGRPVVGAGPTIYPTLFARGRGPRDPLAADLARLVAAEATELVDPEPVYLRRPDAVAPGKPKPVS